MMTKRKRWKLGELLLRLGLIDAEQLNAGLTYQKLERAHDEDAPLGEFFTKHRIVSPKVVSTLLAYQEKHAEKKEYKISGLDDQRVLGAIDSLTARQHGIFPIVLKESPEEAWLYLAMRDPEDRSLIEDIEFRSGYFVKPVKADDESLTRAIERYYPSN
ncbi:MAG: hypothetical protein A2284_08490 [Deltaproteobacteria bacterium RIFOXYA12_FULL_61_11]|nr:MAG: hypothetical protein A2284_08490 [Deltaproteobacteria bacterium RIFOXYA12_FULL_61_11]